MKRGKAWVCFANSSAQSLRTVRRPGSSTAELPPFGEGTKLNKQSYVAGLFLTLLDDVEKGGPAVDARPLLVHSLAHAFTLTCLRRRPWEALWSGSMRTRRSSGAS